MWPVPSGGDGVPRPDLLLAMRLSRTSLRCYRAPGRIYASKGGFKCRRETRLDLAVDLAVEDRAVFAAERGNGLVYAVALHEKRTVHVDGADGAVDAEEVEFYDGFAGRAFR